MKLRDKESGVFENPPHPSTPDERYFFLDHFSLFGWKRRPPCQSMHSASSVKKRGSHLAWLLPPWVVHYPEYSRRNRMSDALLQPDLQYFSALLLERSDKTLPDLF